MAIIHPLFAPPAETPSSPPSGGVPIDVAAWTEEASQALDHLSLDAAHDAPAPAVMRNTSVTLDIPLDGPAARATTSEKKPVRRDSLKSREALLKGKEGSRQRRRWENDRLLSNPWMQPPLPSDWEVRPPTHTTSIPYFLAPLWDNGLAAHAAARAEKNRKAISPAHKSASKGVPSGKGHVPRDFKLQMKKSKGARGMLRDLETEVRAFVQRSSSSPSPSQSSSSDDEEEEMVFVDRDGEMHERSWRSLERELCLFASAADDPGATFCRYLVHQIGMYYGLKTWSVTTGRPARREAYVALHPSSSSPARLGAVGDGLPRPLWGLV